jgi:hypothetical protein
MTMSEIEIDHEGSSCVSDEGAQYESEIAAIVDWEIKENFETLGRS